MKGIIIVILAALIGFYGVALLIDTPEIFLIKSKVLFGGLVLLTLLGVIDFFRERKNRL